MKDRKRMVLRFGPRTQQEIADIAVKQEISKTELVRRAIALYLEISQQVTENGARRIAVIEGETIIEKYILR